MGSKTQPPPVKKSPKYYEIRECGFCHEYFEARIASETRYCSAKCSSSGRRKPRYTFTCERCGDKFVARKNQRTGKDRRYCSKRECFDGQIITKPCKHCGKPFTVTKARLSKGDRGSYCSRKCFDEYRKENKKLVFRPFVCEQCGKKVDKDTSKPRGDGKPRRFCSLECSHRFFIGKNGPNWKGGGFVDSDGTILKADGRRLLRNPLKCNGRTNPNYLREHRRIIEMLLGRYLTDDEVVWHIDRDNSNNSIDNLYLFRSRAEVAACMRQRVYPSVSNLPIPEQEMKPRPLIRLTKTQRENKAFTDIK